MLDEGVDGVCFLTAPTRRPVSLMAATVFNEGMWQRVWAAEDQKALKQGRPPLLHTPVILPPSPELSVCTSHQHRR
jgi:hypothetical protein